MSIGSINCEGSCMSIGSINCEGSCMSIRSINNTVRDVYLGVSIVSDHGCVLAVSIVRNRLLGVSIVRDRLLGVSIVRDHVCL